MPSFVIIRRTEKGDEFLRDHEKILEKKEHTWVGERSFACRFFNEKRVKEYVSSIRARLSGSGNILCELYE